MMKTAKRQNFTRLISLLLVLIFGANAYTSNSNESTNLLFLKSNISYQDSKTIDITLHQSKSVWAVLPAKTKPIFLTRMVEANQIDQAFALIQNSKKSDSTILLIKLAQYIKVNDRQQIKNVLLQMHNSKALKHLGLYGLTAWYLEEGDLKKAQHYASDKDNSSMIDHLRIALLFKQGQKDDANALFSSVYENTKLSLTDSTIEYQLKESMPQFIQVLYPKNTFLQMISYHMNHRNNKILAKIVARLLSENYHDLAYKMVITLNNSHRNMALKSFVAQYCLEKSHLNLVNKIIASLPKNSIHTKLLTASMAEHNKKYKKSLDIYMNLDPIKVYNIGWNYNFLVGILYERLGNIALADKYLSLAVSETKNNADITNYLAYTRVNNNIKIKESLQMLKKVYKKSPTSYIADSLGWAYYKDEQYKKAVYFLELASTTMPTEGVVNEHLGDAYLKVGRLREALVQWKRVIALDSDNKDVNIDAVNAKIIKHSKAN